MSKTKGEEKHICRPDLHLAVLSLTVSVNRSKLTAAKASRSSAVKGRIFIFVLFYFFFGGEEEAWRSRFCKKRGAADAGPARVVPFLRDGADGRAACECACHGPGARARRASKQAGKHRSEKRKKAAAPLVSRENRWPLVETRVKNINSRRARLESQRAPRSSHLPRWHARPRASLQGLKQDRARGRSAVSTAPAKKSNTLAGRRHSDDPTLGALPASLSRP